MLDLADKLEDYLNQNVRGYLPATSMAGNVVLATDTAHAEGYSIYVYVYSRNLNKEIESDSTKQAIYQQNTIDKQYDVVLSV